jgi:uncharacterized protein YfiM (DUF2279 family)
MIAQLLLLASVALQSPDSAEADSARAHVAVPDQWFAPDKIKHFLIAGTVESGAFATSEAAGLSRRNSFVAGVAVMAAFSLGREIHDKRVKNEFSWRDLTWDALGASAALVMLHHTQSPP